MTVQLGAKPLADFSQPIEMMQDCHRRIEHFLGVLIKVTAQYGTRELTEEARQALAASLNYFANFAPRHTEDEEQSLFPRMRARQCAEVREVMAELDRLERDHRQGEVHHARVDQLVRQWLASGSIEARQREYLQQALDALASMYAAHIQQEEDHVFALASQQLAPGELRDMGEEMKRRRSPHGLRRGGVGEASDPLPIVARDKGGPPCQSSM